MFPLPGFPVQTYSSPFYTVGTGTHNSKVTIALLSGVELCGKALKTRNYKNLDQITQPDYAMWEYILCIN